MVLAVTSFLCHILYTQGHTSNGTPVVCLQLQRQIIHLIHQEQGVTILVDQLCLETGVEQSLYVAARKLN